MTELLKEFDVTKDNHTFEERLMSRFERTTDGCWRWVGTMTWGGYGQISRHGRNTTAHRAMWEHLVGTIPSGMVIDHLCLNRACVNPRHMEIVTYSENNRRRFQVREPLRTAA